MKVMLNLVIALLWYLGGQTKNWVRDVLIPVIIGFFFAIKYVWWLGLILIVTYSIMRMGYGNFL